MPLKNISEFKQDLVLTGLLILSFSIILQIVLYKESFLISLMTVLRFFYSIVIPGLCISLYLKNKLNYSARLVLGSVFIIASTSITSYYLGILGLHVKYHPWIIPPLMMLLGVLLFLKKDKK